MSITVIIPMTPLLEFPSLAYRALGTYNLMAYNWAKHMREVAWPQLNALAAATYNNALAAQGYAQTLSEAVVDASSAAGQALSAANFKGEWPTLAALPNPASRVLNRPACVKNDGRFWLLLVDLPDLATSEPGPSNTDWTVSDQGVIPSQTVTTNGATVNCVAGVRYVVDANNVNLVAPPILLKGDYWGWRLMEAAAGAVAKFGTTPLRKALVDDFVLDIPRMELDLYYEDPTRGFV